MTINDEETNTFVSELIYPRAARGFLRNRKYWIGGNRYPWGIGNGIGDWVWVESRKKMEYTSWDWKSGQPNSDNFLAIKENGWSAETGEEKLSFICSKKTVQGNKIRTHRHL